MGFGAGKQRASVSTNINKKNSLMNLLIFLFVFISTYLFICFLNLFGCFYLFNCVFLAIYFICLACLFTCFCLLLLLLIYVPIFIYLRLFTFDYLPLFICSCLS